MPGGLANVAAMDPSGAAAAPALALLVFLRVAPVCGLLGGLAFRRPVVLGPLAIALLLTAVLLPLAMAGVPADGAALLTPAAAVRALLVGGLLAVVVASPLLALVWFGGGVGGVMGLPAREHSPLARLYGALAVALFFAVGGHRQALELLVTSLALLPLTGPTGPLPQAWASQLGAALGRALTWALLWLAPLWGSLLLFDGLLALLSRFVGRGAWVGAGSPLRLLVAFSVLVAGGAFVVELFPDALAQAVRAARLLLGG